MLQAREESRALFLFLPSASKRQQSSASGITRHHPLSLLCQLPWAQRSCGPFFGVTSFGLHHPSTQKLCRAGVCFGKVFVRLLSSHHWHGEGLGFTPEGAPFWLPSWELAEPLGAREQLPWRGTGFVGSWGAVFALS